MNRIKKRLLLVLIDPLDLLIKIFVRMDVCLLILIARISHLILKIQIILVQRRP